MDLNNQRIVCWFSHGAASAVAAKLAIEDNNNSDNPKELVVVSIFIEEEHEDNARFKAECEKWLGQEIITIKDEQYNASVGEVIRKTKYMSGVAGARCTKELKKRVRMEWQRYDDIHVFGMTCDEEHRIDRLLDAENEIEVYSPLIEHGVNKQQCFTILEEAGIRLPEMYHLGYPNNNCKGCLKVTSLGYWNKTRVDFPELFAERAEQERLLGVALCKMSGKKFEKLHPDHFNKMKRDHEAGLVKWSVDNRGGLRIPLRYLPPDAGVLDPIYVPDCGFFCEPNKDEQ